MSDREDRKTAFLAEAGWGDAHRLALPGDASTRRYERLTMADGATVLLMDQPPSLEAAPAQPDWSPERRLAEGWNATARLSAGRIEAFVAVAEHLRSLGLSAPRVIAADPGAGLAVIEDFGDDLMARAIEAGASPEPLYGAAIDALVRLHAAGTPPAVLHGSSGDWPIQVYDETALRAGADLFLDWWPRLVPDVAFDEAARRSWRSVWAPVVQAGASGANVLAHRDYHAENLIRLPGREGVEGIGMIDFQDAVVAHPAWDLHSLLQDARRDVPPELEAAMLDRYLDRAGVTDRAGFRGDYTRLAALNQVRILGVFARLIARDGKPRYRDFLPRMWRLLNANLARPELAEVADWFDRHVPGTARA